MKQSNKDRLLNQDLPRFCKQIGILPGEEPKPILNTKQMNELDLAHSDVQSQKAICSGYLGVCFSSLRIIYVRESPHLRNGKFRKKEYFKNSRKYAYKSVPKRWNYSEQLWTLVHELVHYRFRNLQHGWTFNQRIREILRGEAFEQKHIHWFEGYTKGDRILIDGSSNEEIEKYFKTQEKAKATRAKTHEKDLAYWKLYEELKAKAETLDFLSRHDLEDFLSENHKRKIPVDTRLMRLQRKSKELM